MSGALSSISSGHAALRQKTPRDPIIFDIGLYQSDIEYSVEEGLEQGLSLHIAHGTVTAQFLLWLSG
jgi:hypothetical protein